jgi:peptide/nickel transport system ATP-binding protein
MTPILTVQDLRAHYILSAFGETRSVSAVDNVSLQIGRNEIYGLAGESSSGKTTLIRTIAGAIRPPLRILSGSIEFDFAGKHLAMQTATPAELAAIRWKHLSYVMQGSMSVLNPVRRVRHSFVDFAHRHIGGAMPAFLDTVRAHILRLDLAPHVLEAYPHELSGGMRQRLAIALATICRPDFIIADEPTTALDVVVQKSVLAMIRSVQREFGSSMLFVTHDLSVHANLTDRLGIMYAGRLVEEAATADLFRHPKHPYTKHLVASLPRIGTASVATADLAGRPPSLAAPPAGCRFHPRCPLAMPICAEQAPPMRAIANGHRVACFAVGDSA